jgi:O-antigen/teichoic acid export membrane protein
MSTEARQPEALFRPALVLMSGRIGGFVVAFVVPMILARIFSQAEFGTYKQLMLIFATLFAIAQMGLAESLYYFLPSQSKNAGRYVFNTVLATTVLGLGSLAGMWLYREEIAALMNNPALSDLMLPLGLFLLFMLMSVVLEIIMTIRRQFKAAAFTYALTDLVRAAFYIGPVLVLADLRALLLGAVVFALARLAVSLLYLRREFGTELKPDRQAFIEQARYVLPIGIAGMMYVALSKYHFFAVSNAYDAATFAIYAVGCLQLPSGYLMTSTGNVMMVNMRERLIDGDLEGARSVWLDAHRKLAMAIFPLMAALLIMAYPFIVLLFTRTYEASVPIFQVSVLGMAFSVLLIGSALRVLALTRLFLVNNTLRLILIVTLLHPFMNHFGLIGAVLVTVLADAVTKTFALEWIRRELKVGLAGLLPWKAFAITAVLSAFAAAPAWAVVSWLNGPELVQLLVAGPVYALTYYLLLRHFGPLDPEEQEHIVQWLQKPFGWFRRVTTLATGN